MAERSYVERLVNKNRDKEPDPKTVNSKYFKKRKEVAAKKDVRQRSGVTENEKFKKIIASVKKLKAVRAKTAKAKTNLPKEKTERLADYDKRIKQLETEAEVSAAKFKRLRTKYQKDRKKK